MPELSVEIDGSTASTNLGEIPAALSRSLVQGMVRIGLELLRHLKSDLLSGAALNVRTGTGRRAAFYRVEMVGRDELSVVVGEDLSKAPYMRAQDSGAVIGPKGSANLAIPIGEARTGKGVPRFTARQLIANPQAFGYVGTFVHNHVIFGKQEDGHITPLFALKPTTVLKPVGYLARTVNERRSWITDQLNSTLQEGLGGG